MIKTFGAIAFSLLTLLDGGSAVAIHSDTPISEVSTSETIVVEINFAPTYCEYQETNDILIIKERMNECQKEMDSAHQMAEAARALGYPESHPIISLAKSEYEDAKTCYEKYQEKYKELQWAKRESEYPIASEVWLYLKSKGYSDHVCAGIIGNMMAETGGNTLNLKDYLYDSSGKFYGICQWSTYYYPGVKGAKLYDQCVFLTDTIKYEIDTFGFKYKKDFDYNTFIEMTDVKEIALAFAKAYERCAPEHYSVRKTNAEKAYKYFVN